MLSVLTNDPEKKDAYNIVPNGWIATSHPKSLTRFEPTGGKWFEIEGDYRNNSPMDAPIVLLHCNHAVLTKLNCVGFYFKWLWENGKQSGSDWRNLWVVGDKPLILNQYIPIPK